MPPQHSIALLVNAALQTMIPAGIVFLINASCTRVAAVRRITLTIALAMEKQSMRIWLWFATVLVAIVTAGTARAEDAMSFPAPYRRWARRKVALPLLC